MAWAGALLIEALVVALLVYLARSDSYSLPEPIPVGVILEQPAPPPAALPMPPQPTAPDEPRGRHSGPTSGDSDKPVAMPQPAAGVADAPPADAPPTPAAPPTPLPSAPAASAPIEPLAKGRQAIPAAPVRSPATTASTTPSRPKPSPTRAPQGRPIDLNHIEPGSGDRYLNEISHALADTGSIQNKLRALGLTGIGMYEITPCPVGPGTRRSHREIDGSTNPGRGRDADHQDVVAPSPIPPDIPGEPIQLYWTVPMTPP